MTIDLDAIKARLTNADPGPWAIGKKYAAVIVPSMEQDCECSICPPGKSCNDEYGGKLVGESIERHNAEFIANAPSDIAALIEEVERLQEIAKEATQVQSWIRGSDVLCDGDLSVLRKLLKAAGYIQDRSSNA